MSGVQNAPSERQETLLEKGRRLTDRGRAFVIGRMLTAAETSPDVAHHLEAALDGAHDLDRIRKVTRP